MGQLFNHAVDEIPGSVTDNNVARYEISDIQVFSQVGRGAKGVVFHTRIKDSDEDLALKVVLKSSMKPSKPEKRSNNDQSRVFFEQQVLGEFDHPFLPKLKGVFETSNVYGYAMDYCSGGNLNLLRKQQTEKMFSDDIIRFYAAEMVLALEYLHQRGIVYRDLKPDNVLVQENGHLMLVDFDLSTKLVPISPQPRTSFDSIEKPELEMKKSKLLKFYSFCNSGISRVDTVDSGRNSVESANEPESDSAGKSNSFVGTEEYVAPEIIQGNGHDFAVDWWSLGVVLYEMLYGTTPFRGDNRKETFYRILSKTPELVGETTPLRDLIRKLLDKDPHQRITLEGIKGHDFFKGVDWEMIVRLERPPHIPALLEIGDGVDGIKAINVESIVCGVFESTKIPKTNNNNSNVKDDNSGVNVVNTKSSSRGAWVDGLEQPSTSNNFLVF
ncbi:serine/threonine-protein kinase OXI1 [Silene latifolia]|uniref:serine/threonine-protein kinase OXI1 n=1 Tax=Silene latifolia TaxID=37657 RepID=UPI003D785A86